MIKRLSLLLLLLFVFSCDTNRVFESDIDFENEIWLMDSTAIFEFEVADQLPKDLMIKLRTDLTYPYQNCYVNFKLKDGAGSVLVEHMASLQLFDEKTGKPQGKGNSVYQFKESLISEYRFESQGKYTLELTQYMRMSELNGVYSVGLRVQDSE